MDNQSWACGCAQVRLTLAGKPVLPAECVMHPGRKVCKVESYLAPSA
jgi:hypothetical protein